MPTRTKNVKTQLMTEVKFVSTASVYNQDTSNLVTLTRPFHFQAVNLVYFINFERFPEHTD